jgi:hypothetical protein
VVLLTTADLGFDLYVAFAKAFLLSRRVMKELKDYRGKDLTPELEKLGISLLSCCSPLSRASQS